MVKEKITFMATFEVLNTLDKTARVDFMGGTTPLQERRHRDCPNFFHRDLSKDNARLVSVGEGAET